MSPANGDDDATILTVTDIGRDSRKVVTDRKREQLAAARVKALESRKRTQKASLEARLLEVKSWLGELDHAKIESVQKALLDQANDLQRDSKAVTDQFTALIRDESAKRAQENASIKRSVERLKVDLAGLKGGGLTAVTELTDARVEQSNVGRSVASSHSSTSRTREARAVKTLSEVSGSIFSKDSEKR